MMRKYLVVGASAFVLGAASMAFVNQTAHATASSKPETYHMLELFGDVLTTVDNQYVTPVDDKKLIQSAIDGMLTSLDPHSNYLDADDYKDMRDQTRGEYGGLGLEVTAEDGVIKVVTPMDDTPASRAGLKSGDYITAIDDKSVLGVPLDQAVKQMRGDVGQPITLTISRDRKDPFDVKLVREVIAVKSVKSEMKGDYGYIRISNFDEKTGDETVAAVKSLQAKDPHMKGLVLDLRDNPGGLLDQAVAVSDVFLDGGEVVSQRGRDPQDIERYNAKPGDLTNGLPMVVLIDAGTASAAEIVSGALQDRHRAEIVGITSFGKGSVQSVIPLRGGEDGALKLTTARYYTPSGRSIQKTGITPDLEVAETKEQADRIASNAFQFTEASFSNALNSQEGKTRVAPHEPAEAPPANFDVKTGDFQLDRGIDLLKAGSLAALRAEDKKHAVAEVADASGPKSEAVKRRLGPNGAAAPPEVIKPSSAAETSDAPKGQDLVRPKSVTAPEQH
jgi:carboxyl-terminal processing protease